MLKGIPPIISPELLKVLCEMGHSDRIVIADGNFPAETIGKNAIVVRADGHGVPELLEAILKLMPLDTYVDAPVSLMDNGDPDNRPEIWATYKEIVEKNEGDKNIGLIERFDFYDKAKNAFAIVATGETAIYANIILQKGVVIND